jgi:epoxyqueuosine reductase
VPGTLAQSIKSEARRLGFDLAGFTTPDPPPHGPVYENWLALGRHGRMGYLATERARARRLDPRLILPECRTILALGIRYSAPTPPPAGEGRVRAGRVAAYAWGADYHLVLPERLKSLVAFIENEVGHPIPNRWYTDTGPLLERDLAQRAGLGWIGWNTCLINPRLGSYFLLAEILLGLELAPDAPFAADRCGTCRRCIQACPTGCLLPDRTLDARRSISYLTIENKGEIPPELRPLIGEWVFGCDLCQAACPWNRSAAPAGDPAFAPRPGRPRPDLLAELALSPPEFARRFEDSPIRRVQWRGYLRNAAVALGNALAQTSEFLENSEVSARAALQRAAQDDDPLIREHASWALEKSFPPQSARSTQRKKEEPCVLCDLRGEFFAVQDLRN